MPFVTQDHREKPDILIPGDLCYMYYKSMVEDWKNKPCWTTAHKLYQHMIEFRDTGNPYTQAAMELAWQVFFQIYVMEYEQRKRQENGDI